MRTGPTAPKANHNADAIQNTETTIQNLRSPCFQRIAICRVSRPVGPCRASLAWRSSSTMALRPLSSASVTARRLASSESFRVSRVAPAPNRQNCAASGLTAIRPKSSARTSVNWASMGSPHGRARWRATVASRTARLIVRRSHGLVRESLTFRVTPRA